MLTLSAIAVSSASVSLHPITGLGKEHGLTKSDIRILTRFFGLQSVALTKLSHIQASADVLKELLKIAPTLGKEEGLLVYVKTQTHNTPCDTDWLTHIAQEATLERWEVVTLSMNHCASAISAMHLMTLIEEQKPIILLAGEKCFHPSTAQQSGAALGELPVAALFNMPDSAWHVANTFVYHSTEFFANPAMAERSTQKRFERNFRSMLVEFVDKCLCFFQLQAHEVDLVVPYNLNLPVLHEIAYNQGWENRIILDTAPQIGHLFCADVLVNLALHLPKTHASHVLILAAGMGATFAAALLIRKRTESRFRTSTIVFEDAISGSNGPL